jgi:hypothetical protein
MQEVGEVVGERVQLEPHRVLAAVMLEQLERPLPASWEEQRRLIG